MECLFCLFLNSNMSNMAILTCEGIIFLGVEVAQVK